MTEKYQPPKTMKVAVGGSLAGGAVAALAVALSLIQPWEGKRNDPYRDIVGVMTVCYGETQAPMRRYSDAQCAAMLQGRVERDYLAPVLQCVPGIVNRPAVAGAAASLAYNIGTKAFCNSTAARRFRMGDWRGGCDAFRSWVNAGGRRVQGLVNRREAERAMCLKGAV